MLSGSAIVAIPCIVGYVYVQLSSIAGKLQNLIGKYRLITDKSADFVAVDRKRRALIPSREFADIVRERLRKSQQFPKWNILPERNQVDLVVTRSKDAVRQNQLPGIEYL